MSAIDFSPPGNRAGGSDLTMSISPLGLVELADEEFEVHGPRLNRYSLNWAMYLGHHWSYRREAGESQMVFNYFRTFTDYINNFTFGRGVQFRSPKATEAIVPDLLKRVWEVDNDKKSTMWEIGQQGGVSGDVFIKIAYEMPYKDTVGMPHPGRVRILPLNAAHCFPEWHPHDRTRMIRFKMKYRFWGTSLEGTRQVFTYTEIMTDDAIEEYINDEMIDSRPNNLGVIPVVHIANTRISNSPWGLPDCHDIISLNKAYNETATEIADIVSYHAAPVTIVTGAKTSNLEKGAKKVWAIPSAEARVYNLEGGGAGLTGALEYLNMLKIAMHEHVGVPESALGQMQPISNTSGVALSIQFQPLMNRYQQKIIQYAEGFEKINFFILKTLALFEPDSLIYNEATDLPLKEGQLPQLDPEDPITYKTIVHFLPPLPLDKLIALNEQQTMIAMQLQSKEGALRELGEEFPDEKLQEIRDELMSDARWEAELRMVQATTDAAVMALTGMIPGPEGTSTPIMTQTPEGIDVPQGGSMPQMEQQAEQDLLTKAYGTRAPSYNPPSQ